MGGGDQPTIGWLYDNKKTDGWTRATSTASRYRYFFALARTRPSNTLLRIVVCAVWNGFNIACDQSASPVSITTTTPSSTAPTPRAGTPGFPPRSCSRAAAQTLCLPKTPRQRVPAPVRAQLTPRRDERRHRPLVELVHGLEIPVTALSRLRATITSHLTSHSPSASHLQSRPDLRLRSSGSRGGPVPRPSLHRPLAHGVIASHSMHPTVPSACPRMQM